MLRAKKEKFITWLRYVADADDVTLVQKGRRKFGKMVESFFQVTEKFGITVSCEASKTRVMRVGFRGGTPNRQNRPRNRANAHPTHPTLDHAEANIPTQPTPTDAPNRTPTPSAEHAQSTVNAEPQHNTDPTDPHTDKTHTNTVISR